MAGFGTFGPVVEPKSVTRERPERGGSGPFKPPGLFRANNVRGPFTLACGLGSGVWRLKLSFAFAYPERKPGTHFCH